LSLIKHLVNILTLPLADAALLALLGLMCYLRGVHRSGRFLLMAAAALAYLCSLKPVGELLLEPLESRYHPLDPAALSAPVGYIVVLGADYAPGDEVPVSAALNDDGLKRIVEAVVLMRRFGIGRIVVSGGAPPGHVPSARGYAALARELGVADAAIVISDRSLDTGAEAHAVAKLVGAQNFVLVTSAYHMPRAFQLLTRVGSHPIPAPCGQRVRPNRRFSWRSFVPTGDGLGDSERALHEYLGLASLSMGFE